MPPKNKFKKTISLRINKMLEKIKDICMTLSWLPIAGWFFFGALIIVWIALFFVKRSHTRSWCMVVSKAMSKSKKEKTGRLLISDFKNLL